MALGDALNNLAGGYQRGQAQFAANEDARQKAAAAGAKAAQDAAEFRLKLATHSQALTNSAEAEYNAIMAEITGDNWDPAKIPALMPRVANFDKTYGAVWGGGSATEALKKALHLDGGGGQMGDGVQGPVDPNAANPLAGYTSQSQKDAADKKARESRSAEAARNFTVMAMDHVRTANGSLPDEATFYRKIYDFQEMIERTHPGEFDGAIIDAAMDIIRENAAGYYKGVANQLDQLSKQTTLSDAISERTDKTIRNISQWVNQLLMFDANGNAMTGDLFAERTPLRLEMEKAAAALAMQGMSEGQIRANLIFKHRDEMGGLELDIRNSPYQGSLTLMSAPPEFKGAVNRFYDLNESPDEDQIVPMWREADGTGWVVNSITGEGKQIYKPIPTPDSPSVIQGQGTPYPKVPANSSAASVTAPKPKAAQGQTQSLTPEQQRRVDEYETYIAGPAKAAGRVVPSAIEALFPDLKTGTNPFAPKGKK